MKIVYYWVQMRFARRAWIEGQWNIKAMKDMHYYKQALDKAKKGR
jgi:hypothetical protein